MATVKRIDHRARKARLEQALKDALQAKDRDLAFIVKSQLAQYRTPAR